MKTLELENHRKARVWIEELPNASYSPIKIVSRQYPAIPSDWPPNINTCAVEFKHHTFSYGLLGASFAHDNSSAFKVSIACSSDDGPVYSDAFPIDDWVRVGLPTEYAEGVFSGITMFEKSSVLSSGTLTINVAAHSALRSSRNAYMHITMVLMRIFALNSRAASEQQLADLCSAAN